MSKILKILVIGIVLAAGIFTAFMLITSDKPKVSSDGLIAPIIQNSSEQLSTLDNKPNLSEQSGAINDKSHLLNSFYINITSSEVIIEEDGIKLKAAGILVNNLDEGINNLYLQLRMYNENELNNVLKDVPNRKSRFLKMPQTNQYLNFDAALFNNKSSLNLFGKGEHSFNVTFEDLPPYDSSEYLNSLWERDYLFWFEGKYDIDRADLILYMNKTEVQREAIRLGDLYEKDVRLNVFDSKWFYDKSRYYLDSFTFQINSSGFAFLKNPNLVFYTLEDEYAKRMVLNLAEKMSIYNSVNLRLVPKNDEFVYDNKTRIIQLRDGDTLLDQQALSNFYHYDYNLSLNSGYSLIFKDYYASSGEIEVIVSKGKKSSDIENPIIELICGRSKTYKFDGEYGTPFAIKLREGCFCETPIILLRDGDFAEIYAKNNSGNLLQGYGHEE